MKRFHILLALLIVFIFEESFAGGGFGGQTFDSTGSYYLRARYYDPETGRFLSKDPIGIAGGLDTYEYVSSDPINGVDPLGLYNWWDYTAQSASLVGGLITTGLGVGLVGGGGATVEFFGLGIPVAAAGVFLTAQGVASVGGSTANLTYMWNHPNETTLPLNSSGAAGLAVSGIAYISGSKNSSSISAFDENGDISWLGIGNGAATIFDLVTTFKVGDAATDIANGTFQMGTVLRSLGANHNLFDETSALGTVGKLGQGIGTDDNVKTVEDTLLEWAFPAESEGGGESSSQLDGSLNAPSNNSVPTFSSGSFYYSLYGYVPPVGGVLIDTSATLVGQNLSDFTGAMYDPTSGQFVLLGTNNPTPIEGVNLDYLYTGLQAIYGSAQPPFVTLNPSAVAYSPWSGNSLFQPGQQGGFTIQYNPFWANVDTTVDAIVRATWSGVNYSWRARFNCVAAGSNYDGTMVTGFVAGGRPLMRLVFSNWVADATDTLPPAGINLNTSYFNAGSIESGEVDNLTPTSQNSLIPFTLTNSTTNNFIITSVLVVPAVQQREFGGRVEGSKVGWVMEEADRVMKCLNVGADNITSAVYSSKTITTVPGYSNMLERLTGSGNNNLAFTRFWFTPNQMTLQEYIDPKTGLASIVFTNASVSLNTESYMLGLPQLPQALAFSSNFTTNYDKFAAMSFPCHNPNDPTGQSIIYTNIFGMLRDVMKAVSLARFFRDNNIPVDTWWLNSYQTPVAYTPKSVPTAVNISSSAGIESYGGVQVNLPNTYIPSTTASNVAATVQSARAALATNPNGDIQQQLWTNSTSVGSLKAVSVNSAAEPQDGNLNFTETDLKFASSGGMPLKFTRYYQSAYLAANGLGRGWRWAPVELQFQRPSWYDQSSLMHDASGNLLYTLPSGDTGLRSGAIRVVELSSGATLDFNSSLVLGYAVNNVGNAVITVNGLTNDVPYFSAGQNQNGSTLVQNPDDLSYEFTTPDGQSFIFDNDGNLLQIQNRYGQTQTYVYDGAEHLLNVLDAAYQSLSFTYDPTTNYIISVSGPANEQVIYGYTNGLLITATRVRSGATVSYQYNTNNQLIGKTIFNGLASVQSQPDLKGRAAVRTDGRGNSIVSTFTQGTGGAVRTNTMQDPLVTGSQFTPAMRQWDRSGRLLASQDSTGNQTSYGYNTGSMLPSSVALPIAGRPPITIQRDGYGKPTRISDPGNVGAQDVTVAYDPITQQPTLMTDQAGHATTLLYNSNNNISDIQSMHNGQLVDVNISYDAAGQLSQVNNPLGIVAATINRDSLERVSSVVDATGVRVGYSYDSLGRMSQVSDPRLSRPVQYVYDHFDRVTEIDYPCGTNYFAYDPVKGWLISQTDMLGRTTLYGRDPNTGDILQTEQVVPGGTNLVTVMTYDRFGDLTSVTPPQSATITYTYDALGRQTGDAYSGTSIPGAPNALVCNWATNNVPTWKTNLIFSWQPPVSSVGLVGYSCALDQMPASITNTVTASAAVNNVTIGTHLFQVKALGTNGMWGPTADFQLIVTWVPGTQPPGAPPGLVCNVTANGVATYATNVTFSWQVPASQNGVAGYSYALNGTPANVINTTATNATLTAPVGNNTFQVKAEGSNNVWGTASTFRLIVEPTPNWSQSITIHIGGCASSRALIYACLTNLFDPGFFCRQSPGDWTGESWSGSLANDTYLEFWGTMNNIPGFELVAYDPYLNPPADVTNITPVIVICSFNGSLDGITNFNAGGGGYDLVASDVADPPLSANRVDDIFGVMPYLFACNPAVFGVHNITRDQAALLFTSSGAVPGQPFQGMSAAYLGGVATSPLYLIGGDSNSGTRRNIEKNIGFAGSEILWATNYSGQFYINNGFSSEANVASLIANLPATIGYLDWQDYLSVSNQVVPLAFNGAACTPAATANGNYELWSYLRFWRPGEGGPTLQANLGAAMINCLTNSAFETGPVIQNGIIPIPSMQVWRGSGLGDAGDQIYPLNY